MKQHSLDGLPDVLTIHEAAEFMRISSGLAYSMARRYRATHGREGLPVFMTGTRVMREAPSSTSPGISPVRPHAKTVTPAEPRRALVLGSAASA